ncbi:GntR family transcriptional regulator [Streptomyces sp. NPDC002758]
MKLHAAAPSCALLPTDLASGHGRHAREPGSRRVRVYRQVADHIAAEIAAGRLRPGARLPGERALAEQYGLEDC